AAGRAGQFDGVVEFPIDKEPGVTADGRAVELQFHLAVEVNALGVLVAASHWVPRPFRQEAVGKLGFPGERRKRHAEPTKPSGKSGGRQLGSPHPSRSSPPAPMLTLPSRRGLLILPRRTWPRDPLHRPPAPRGDTPHGARLHFP